MTERWNGILRFWRSLDPKRRALVIGLAALGAIVVAALLQSGTGEFVRIYRGEGGKAAEVARSLREAGIPAELRPDGVYVPEPDRDRAVMQLAVQGERLDDAAIFSEAIASDWMSTAHDKKLRYRLALQRKLALMIRSLDSVRDATVQITPGAASMVLGNRAGLPAKASVMITLQPSVPELSPPEAAGIAKLVAASVPGLNPSNVQILDRSGRLYSGKDGTDPWAGIRGRRAVEAYQEKVFEEKVAQILSPKYGDVTVSASVRVSGKTVEIEENESDRSAVGPQKAMYTDVSTEGKFKGVTDPYGDEPGNTLSVRKIRRREVIGPGEIAEASLSILVPVPADTSIPEERANVARLAHFATGVPLDRIAVHFVRSRPQQARVSDREPPPGGRIWTGPALGLGALLLLLLGGLMIRRRRRPPPRNHQGVARRTRNELRELADFLKRRLVAEPETGARVLEELPADRAALVLSQLDELTTARVLTHVEHVRLIRILNAQSRRQGQPASPAEIQSALTECAEAIVIPRP